MKKRLTALLLIFVLLLSMSGCAAANALESRNMLYKIR